MKMKKIMKIQWHGLDCLVNKVRRKRTFNAIVSLFLTLDVHTILEMKTVLPIEPYVKFDRMGLLEYSRQHDIHCYKI